MCDKTDFQIPAEHLIFLATLLEEQDNEENWNELQNAFDESSKGQLFFLKFVLRGLNPVKQLTLQQRIVQLWQCPTDRKLKKS